MNYQWGNVQVVCDALGRVRYYFNCETGQYVGSPAIGLVALWSNGTVAWCQV